MRVTFRVPAGATVRRLTVAVGGGRTMTGVRTDRTGARTTTASAPGTLYPRRAPRAATRG